MAGKINRRLHTAGLVDLYDVTWRGWLSAGKHDARQRCRQKCQVTATPGKPRSQITAHHHIDTRRVRAVLDSMAHPVTGHRLLFGQRVVRRTVVTVRYLLLAVLSQQPDQPVLLCAGQ